MCTCVYACACSCSCSCVCLQGSDTQSCFVGVDSTYHPRHRSPRPLSGRIRAKHHTHTSGRGRSKTCLMSCHVQIFKHFLSTAKRRKTQTVGNPSVDGCPSAQGTMEALEAFETCYGMASPVCCYNGRGSDDGYSTCWWWLFLFLQKVV